MRKPMPISSAKQRFRGDKELIQRIENLPPSFYEPQERDGQPAYYSLYDNEIHLVFWCPLCLKWHIHGGGNGGIEYYGTRVPHCLCKERPRYYTLLKWD